MTEPQAWTLIGVFAAAVLGGFTLVVTSLSRVIRAEVGGLRAEMRGELGGLRAEMRGELDGVKHEVAAVNKRLDRLDGDVQAITNRLLGS
ncbi:MAG: hypothetical protein ACTHON_13125 [Humibacter sp.]